MNKLLLETICIENGQIQNPEYHIRRMQQSSRKCWGHTPHFLTKNLHLPKTLPKRGKFKWRIIYGSNFWAEQILPYQIKPVKTLRLIHANTLNYAHKFADRSSINMLLSKKEKADDIAIVKNGFLTDTSFANIVLFDGQSWWTPAHPLLQGTQRQKLLEEGILKKDHIKPSDIPLFKEIRIINAMINLDEAPKVKIIQ